MHIIIDIIGILIVGTIGIIFAAFMASVIVILLQELKRRYWDASR
jgi:predicted PurR-regulated permease PerM